MVSSVAVTDGTKEKSRIVVSEKDSSKVASTVESTDGTIVWGSEAVTKLFR